MNITAINFNNKPYQPQTKLAQKNIAASLNYSERMPEFPSYYCPNIAFHGSKFGTIDFEFDFYNRAKEIVENHLDDVDLTKNLDEYEQGDFQLNVNSADRTTLLHFLFDKKPAVLLGGEYPYLENHDKYDVVPRNFVATLENGKKTKLNNTFLINKELTKQTIDENKELYTKRMGFEDGVSTDEIYEKLVSKNSPLTEPKGYDDIIGVTLGFSPINSILFQLEKEIPNGFSLRKNQSAHAGNLEKVFKSEDSPYRDFSDEFKSNVQASLDFIKSNWFKKPNLHSIGYTYIQLAPDEKHTNKIIKDAETVLDMANEVIEKGDR